LEHLPEPQGDMRSPIYGPLVETIVTGKVNVTLTTEALRVLEGTTPNNFSRPCLHNNQVTITVISDGFMRGSWPVAPRYLGAPHNSFL